MKNSPVKLILEMMRKVENINELRSSSIFDEIENNHESQPEDKDADFGDVDLSKKHEAGQELTLFSDDNVVKKERDLVKNKKTSDFDELTQGGYENFCKAVSIAKKEVGFNLNPRTIRDWFESNIKGRKFLVFDDARVNDIEDDGDAKSAFFTYTNQYKNNVYGRLGYVFEMLFGNEADNKSDADFGEGEGATEAKTKNLDSGNQTYISICGNRMKTLDDVADSCGYETNNSKVLSEMLEMALSDIESKTEYDPTNYFKASKTRKSFSISSQQLVSAQGIIDNAGYKDLFGQEYNRHALKFNRGKDVIVDITTLIFATTQTRETGMVFKYNLSLSGAEVKSYVTTNNGRSEADLMLVLQFALTPLNDEYGLETITKEIELPLSVIFKKIKLKCPNLVVATGRDGLFEQNADNIAHVSANKAIGPGENGKYTGQWFSYYNASFYKSVESINSKSIMVALANGFVKISCGVIVNEPGSKFNGNNKAENDNAISVSIHTSFNNEKLKESIGESFIVFRPMRESDFAKFN